MKANRLTAVVLALSACGSQFDAKQVADLQAKSALGPTNQWDLEPELPLVKVQAMRDRAYQFCLSEKASDEECVKEQDHSLFQYANTFRLVRIFRSEENPTYPYAVAHKNDPSAFERIQRYCLSLYEDQGARDARALGPCMSAAVGADFFRIVPVS